MNNHKKHIWIWGVCLALILSVFFVAPQSSFAQGTWCMEIDFSTGLNGWSFVTAGTVETGGLGADYWFDGSNGNYNVAHITYTLSSATNITYSYARWDASPNIEDAGPVNYIYYDDNAILGQRPATADATASGTNLTMSSSSSYTANSFLGINIYAGYRIGSGDPGGTALLKFAEFQGTGTNPFGTSNCSTTTPTPTQTATGTIDPALVSPACILLGERATFSNMSGWAGQNGATNPAGRNRALSLPEGASASTNLGLNAQRAYTISLKYHAGAAADDSFNISLGDSNLSVYVAPGTAIQNVTFPPANFTGSILTISRSSGAPISLIIDYVCVAPGTPTVSALPSFGDANRSLAGGKTCAACDWPDGFDLISYLQYLVCKIANLICWLAMVINEVGRAVGNIAMNLASFVKFLWDSFWGFPPYLLALASAFVQYMNGFLLALPNTIANGIMLTWGANVNQGARAAADIQGFILTTYGDAGGTLAGIVTQGFELTEIFTTILSLLLTALKTIIQLVPILIGSFIEGYNFPVLNTINYNIRCGVTTSDFVFYPCVGFYILDNTLFSADTWSWGGYLLVLITGGFAFKFTKWALYKIASSLGKH